VGGLGARGTLVVIGASAEPLQVPTLALITGALSVRGWYSGMSIDSEDTLAFSVLSGVRPMNELFPLTRAREAYERMMSGAARFRVVLQVA
jgi:D-arabinose 1-dehydrogenase-like Zn-dependent alcohol dehydrogenase